MSEGVEVLMKAQPAKLSLSAQTQSATIRVSRHSINIIHEALVRTVDSSKSMRQALDRYDKAARDSELLMDKAQNAVSDLLTSEVA